MFSQCRYIHFTDVKQAVIVISYLLYCIIEILTRANKRTNGIDYDSCYMFLRKNEIPTGRLLFRTAHCKGYEALEKENATQCDAIKRQKNEKL